MNPTLDPRRNPVVQHPTATVRPRSEPAPHPPFGFPVGTVLTEVPVGVHLAPQPVPATAFAHLGRDHPPRMQRQAQFPSIAEWRGVMGWPFKIIRQIVPLRVPIAPHQGQRAFGERVNIEMPAQVPLGSQTTIRGGVYTGPEYAKLGVWW